MLVTWPGVTSSQDLVDEYISDEFRESVRTVLDDALHARRVQDDRLKDCARGTGGVRTAAARQQRAGLSRPKNTKKSSKSWFFVTDF